MLFFFFFFGYVKEFSDSPLTQKNKLIPKITMSFWKIAKNIKF